MNILLIEDNADLSGVEANILRGEGHAIALAANGKEALQILHRNAGFDLILLDLLLPGMSGQEFLKVLRGLSGKVASVPVIVLTALSKEATVSLEDSGVAAIIHKPMDLSDLLNAVNKVAAGG